METKFHGRRISIDEVIKSINVNVFLLGQFLFSCFFARFYFSTREVYAVARLIGITVLHMLNLLI